MKKLMLAAIRCSLVFTALAALSLARSASANLITNPGFETGDFTGWTAQGFFVVVDNSNPHSGFYEAFMTDVTTLSQTIPTVAGATYDFSMWNAHGPAELDDVIDIFWNGSFIGGGDLIGDEPYLQLTFSDLVATGSSSEISFAVRPGLNGGGMVYLDDVSVTRSGVGVPEPFSILWLALPFAGMVAFRRFRAKGV